jgi:hypothetical protein
MPGSFTAFAGLRGRAELRTVAADMKLQPPAARISELEGSVDIISFANLSYLLHKMRFLDLPNRYEPSRGRFDVAFATVTVVANGKVKSVTDSQEGTPVELWAVQQALDSVSKSIQWTQ